MTESLVGPVPSVVAPDRPQYAMFSIPGTNRFFLLCPPEDIPAGRRSCFPHHGGTMDELMVAELRAIKADLDAGRESYHRVTVHAVGFPRVMRAQRYWSICDAIGREVRTEPVDTEPIDYLTSRTWPTTPKPTTRAERDRRAAA